jgi:hypothetical protein
MKLANLVLKKELTDPVAIYTETYADSQSSERIAKEHCSDVAVKLDKNSIKYAAFDGDFYFDISVSRSDFEMAKKIAIESNLSYWSNYKYWES